MFNAYDLSIWRYTPYGSPPGLSHLEPRMLPSPKCALAPPSRLELQICGPTGFVHRSSKCKSRSACTWHQRDGSTGSPKTKKLNADHEGRAHHSVHRSAPLEASRKDAPVVPASCRQQPAMSRVAVTLTPPQASSIARPDEIDVLLAESRATTEQWRQNTEKLKRMVEEMNSRQPFPHLDDVERERVLEFWGTL